MITDALPLDRSDRWADPPEVLLPRLSDIFLARSRRIASLAEGHSMAPWLSFLGRLTLSQHELLQKYPPLPLSDGNGQPSVREHRVPPIPASSWPRDPLWRPWAAALARELAPWAPAPAREILESIRTMESAALEALADRVLGADLDGPDAAYLPFVAAALQVHWTALAAGLDSTKIAPLDTPGVCPACGFPPVAGVVRTDGEKARLRYLHCGLCNTEWHVVRVTCAACRESGRIAYYHVEGSDGSIRAETCEACRSYLKIVYREKSPEADPVADDLATLALDLAVEEAGYVSIGLNLLSAPSRGTAA